MFALSTLAFSATIHRATFARLSRYRGPAWFTSSPGFFFRPLVFIVYKLLWVILGGYFAPGFHLALVILHVANTVLLGVLASALSRRPTYGWLAALLFATFPLSHEAVAEVDALCHPLSTFWVLLALVLFERGRRTGHKAYLWAVHPIVLLALLTHENGLVIPVLLLILDLIYFPPAPHAPCYAGRPCNISYFLCCTCCGGCRSQKLLARLRIPSAPFYAIPSRFCKSWPTRCCLLCSLSVTQWGGLLVLVGFIFLADVCGRSSARHRASMAFRHRLDGDCCAAVSPVSGLGLPARRTSPVLPGFGGSSASLGLAFTAIFALAKGPVARRWPLIAVGGAR